MSSWQIELKLAVRRGPFAYIYWGVVACGVIVVVGSFWASQQFRSISGPIVFGVVFVLVAIRYWIAVRRSRRPNRRE
ncbi:hypothetical protein ABMA10_14105 [Plantibacter sp. RU18]